MTEESKLPNDWIKCKSRRRPDKYYYFNKKTGESSWIDPNPNRRDGQNNTIPSIELKPEKEGNLPVLKIQKSKKNLAADRLKRLQTNLKANQLKGERNTKLKSLNNKVSLSQSKESNSKKLAKILPPTSLRVVPNPIETTPKKTLSEGGKSAKVIKKPECSSPLCKAEAKESKQKEHVSPNLSPILSRGIANKRLKELQTSLEKQQSIIDDDITMRAMAMDDSMDWEETSGDSSVKNNNDENNHGSMSEYYDSINESSFKISSSSNSFDKIYSGDDFYFVVDTNVLLHNLTLVKELSETVFGGSVNTVIMIPYRVVQELDGLKCRESTATLAIRAIKLLNDKLAAKDSHFKGQNAKHSKEEMIPLDTSDDEILNCCLQIQQTCENVILISDDVNLRNKAIINNIKVLSSTNREFSLTSVSSTGPI